MQLGVSRYCTLCSKFIAVLMGDHGVKPHKNVGLFTSGGQSNSLKKKKPSHLIYFESKFNADML